MRSIFFGGGTPSLMAPQHGQAIIDMIGKAWRIEPNAEITLEANPTSVEAGRFRGYRGAGVNRVSIGVQALNDAELSALGRRHRRRSDRGPEYGRVDLPAHSFDSSMPASARARRPGARN